MTAKTQHLASGVRVGRYEIIELLGEGAMGTVYRARDPLIDRQVALKILHGRRANDPTGDTAKFLREAQAAGQLDHPNIVRVHDCGSDSNGELTYIVMEYLAGPSLEKVIEHHTLAPGAVVELLEQLSSAIDTAHAAGMVHRDIKPANILFTEDGNVAKLADFGVARRVDSSVTQDLSRMATPLYMAPEQAQGKPVNARTDIFALGVLCYHLLSGRRPFSGGDPLALSYQVVHESAPRISEIAPELPASLDAVFDRALAKDPAERFDTAEDFLHAMRTALGGAAVPTDGPFGVLELAGSASSAAESTASGVLDSDRAEPRRPARVRAAFVWGGIVTALVAGLIIGTSSQKLSNRSTSTAEQPKPIATATDVAPGPMVTPIEPAPITAAPPPAIEEPAIGKPEAPQQPEVVATKPRPVDPASAKPAAPTKRDLKPQATKTATAPLTAPTTAETSTPPPVVAVPRPVPEAVATPTPTGTLALSLRHRIQTGTLTVESDGRKLVEENFEKRTPGIRRTSKFDPVELAAGHHRITAHVVGGRGKEYHSEPFDFEIESDQEAALRISIDDGTLVIAPLD